MKTRTHSMNPLAASAALVLLAAASSFGGGSAGTGSIAPRPGATGVKNPDCAARASQIARDSVTAIDADLALFHQGMERLLATYRAEMLAALSEKEWKSRLAETHERYQELARSLADLFIHESLPDRASAGLKALSTLPCGGCFEGWITDRFNESVEVVNGSAASASRVMREGYESLTAE
jgi:hypothetical protein